MAERSGRLGHARARASAPSSTPHRPSPAKKTADLIRNRGKRDRGLLSEDLVELIDGDFKPRRTALRFERHNNVTD